MLDADAKNYEYALSPEVKRAERERVLDIKRRIGTSSLNFGNYPMDYVSDMTRSNQNILEHASRTRRGSASTERRKNKAALSCSKITIGETSPGLKLTRSNVMPDPTGEKFGTYRGVLNLEKSKLLRKSSIVLGDNRIMETRSCANSGDPALQSTSDFLALQAQTRGLKQKLGTSQVTIGYEESSIYPRTNVMPKPLSRGSGGNYRGMLNNETKKIVKDSSLKFGDNRVMETMSTMRAGQEGHQMTGEQTKAKYRDENSEMKRLKKKLSASQLVFGEATTDYWRSNSMPNYYARAMRRNDQGVKK